MAERFQYGSVDLRSGVWEWKASPRENGTIVSFIHRDRRNDEMRSWADSHEITPDELRRLGLDPIYRIWEDPDGLVWQVTIEPPVVTDADESPGLTILFSRPARHFTAPVGDGFELGSLTWKELLQLFRLAEKGILLAPEAYRTGPYDTILEIGSPPVQRER